MESRTATPKEQQIIKEIVGAFNIRDIRIHTDVRYHISIASFYVQLWKVNRRKSEPVKFYGSTATEYDVATRFQDINWYTDRKESINHNLKETWDLELSEKMEV